MGYVIVYVEYVRTICANPTCLHPKGMTIGRRDDAGWQDDHRMTIGRRDYVILHPIVIPRLKIAEMIIHDYIASSCVRYLQI